jgi:hypothetical protein
MLLQSPKQAYAVLLQTWTQGMKTIWGNPDETEAVLESLGTDAAELFFLSSATVQYLEAVSPGSTTEMMALVKEFEVNSDGTVTLVQ